MPTVKRNPYEIVRLGHLTLLLRHVVAMAPFAHGEDLLIHTTGGQIKIQDDDGAHRATLEDALRWSPPSITRMADPAIYAASPQPEVQVAHGAEAVEKLLESWGYDTQPKPKPNPIAQAFEKACKAQPEAERAREREIAEATKREVEHHLARSGWPLGRYDIPRDPIIFETWQGYPMTIPQAWSWCNTEPSHRTQARLRMKADIRRAAPYGTVMAGMDWL